ncbi:hypothetical protein LCGC14_2768700 [marine sediment metagenome]|uniref:Uncharacterized protein n=1 Tax=marine sediment metagenome TaxID=412755 RepID=A0A0F8YWT1_9ZZZZ
MAEISKYTMRLAKKCRSESVRIQESYAKHGVVPMLLALSHDKTLGGFLASAREDLGMKPIIEGKSGVRNEC